MTFLELYGTALDNELSSEDRTSLFTTAKRKQAINDAVERFIQLTDCTKTKGNISIVDGTQEYDLEVAFTGYIKLAGPPSIKIVEGSTTRYIEGKLEFPQRTVEWLDREEPGWRAYAAGTPTCWYLDDDGGETNVGLVPAPDVGSGETWTLIVPYVARPTAMSADGDEPFTISSNVIKRLVPFHYGLVHYAAAKLESLRKNLTGRTYQEQQFAGYVADYLKSAESQRPREVTFARNYLSNRDGRVMAWDRWP